MTNPSDSFWPLLDRLHSEIDAGHKSPADLVLIFVMLHLQEREPGSRWLGSRKNSYPPANSRFKPRGSGVVNLLELAGIPVDQRLTHRLEGCATFDDLLSAYQLKGVRQDSQDGLHGWLRGQYPLTLRFDIPAPLEMLEAQCEGERFVTMLTDADAQFRPIGRHDGAFAFLLHDLEHAHKFFGDRARFRGQVAFFRHMKEALNSGILNELTADERFAGELAYLISDMNSHPLHLFKYLKAITLDVFKRWEAELSEFDDLFNALMDHWKWPPTLRACGQRINNPGQETPWDAEVFTRFFFDDFGRRVEPVVAARGL